MGSLLLESTGLSCRSVVDDDILYLQWRGAANNFNRSERTNRAHRWPSDLFSLLSRWTRIFRPGGLLPMMWSGRVVVFSQPG